MTAAIVFEQQLINEAAVKLSIKQHDNSKCKTNKIARVSNENIMHSDPYEF